MRAQKNVGTGSCIWVDGTDSVFRSKAEKAVKNRGPFSDDTDSGGII